MTCGQSLKGMLYCRMHERLLHHFSRQITLSDQDIALIDAVVQERTLKAREFLLREGDICRYEAFILSGCLRKYCVDEAGHEVNLQFAVEDWWISDLASFTEERPSSLFIQALEPSAVLLIQHADKEQLFQKIPGMERVFRLLIQRSQCSLQDRFVSILTRPAEARYLEFLDRYPQIPLRVPQHHIASFLGMTPEFLSKVRKRLSVKK